MKKLIIAAIYICAALTVQAQGTVTFANVGAGGLNCAVKLSNGTLISNPNTTYTFQLFAGTSAGSLTSVATTTTTIAAGYFSAGTVTVASLAPGGAGFFQVDVWQTSFGSFAAAQAGQATANVWGQSGVFQLAATGNPTTTPAGTPASLVGMGSAITLNPAVSGPEPTTIAFAGMGLGAFLIARRRKA
jgi:hypothetical protein